MTDHLSAAVLSALADGELSADQLANAQKHLLTCQACIAMALERSLLKSATARAGQRHAPSDSLRERILHQTRREALQERADAQPVAISSKPAPRNYGWAAACALLLIFATIFAVQYLRQQSATAATQYAALSTEAIDQHIAALAANAPPQVISSDRHTVKPWFQGKLPFSFNLPETLPSDTTLDGANLTYIHDRPAAQLLFRIGKHRVSVYLQQKTDTGSSTDIAANRSGFHLITFTTGEIDGIAVSDVDPARLAGLVDALAQAQPK